MLPVTVTGAPQGLEAVTVFDNGPCRRLPLMVAVLRGVLLGRETSHGVSFPFPSTLKRLPRDQARDRLVLPVDVAEPFVPALTRQ